MKPLYSTKEFDYAKSNEKMPCECYSCGTTFYALKKEIQRQIKKGNDYVKFCSKACSNKSKLNGGNLTCKVCLKNFYRKKSEIGKNNFCSQSCSATFNNRNKKYGSRRSKLEIWIEEELSNKFTNLDIKYNEKDVIGCELDIFIPSINLAFELNGIFHYEPIFGNVKLESIKLNDNFKLKLCYEKQIDLCIINTSEQKKFNPNKSKKYLDIILEIINSRLTIS